MKIEVKNQQELDAVFAAGLKDGDYVVCVSARFVLSAGMRVVAWENSSVEARENSSVEARENSSVEAWGNSSVVARENSSVVARENSSVVARENSSVVAWGNVFIRLFSALKIKAIASVIISKQGNAVIEGGTVLDRPNPQTPDEVCDFYGTPRSEEIANLDKVREIILSDQARLKMSHWHGDDSWKNKTCAEETICGTTHCLAGFLQVCATDVSRRKLSAEMAGTLQAPNAAKMFHKSNEEVLEWLENREYAE